MNECNAIDKVWIIASTYSMYTQYLGLFVSHVTEAHKGCFVLWWRQILLKLSLFQHRVIYKIPFHSMTVAPCNLYAWIIICYTVQKCTLMLKPWINVKTFVFSDSLHFVIVLNLLQTHRNVLISRTITTYSIAFRFPPMIF